MSALAVLWTLVRASRALQIALAALLSFGGFHAWLWVHDKGVEHKVVANVEKQSQAIAEKATAARDAASRPGAADRLRKRYGEGQ